MTKWGTAVALALLGSRRAHGTGSHPLCRSLEQGALASTPFPRLFVCHRLDDSARDQMHAGGAGRTRGDFDDEAFLVSTNPATMKAA